MASGLNRSATFTRQQYRQIIMIMSVAISNPAPINDHRIVQQGAFAFFDRFELLEEISELAYMKAVDSGNLLLFGLVISVMREIMMPFRNLNEWIRPIAPVVSEQQEDAAAGPEGK